MMFKIEKHFPNSNGWNVGDVVDITNAETLLKQGYVSLVLEKKEVEVTEPVEVEKPEKIVKPKRETLIEKTKKIFKKK